MEWKKWKKWVTDRQNFPLEVNIRQRRHWPADSAIRIWGRYRGGVAMG